MLVIGQYYCVDGIAQHIRLQTNGFGIRFRSQETFRRQDEILFIYRFSEIRQTFAFFYADGLYTGAYNAIIKQTG